MQQDKYPSPKGVPITKLGWDLCMHYVPKESKYPDEGVLGPKYYTHTICWDCRLGPSRLVEPQYSSEWAWVRLWSIWGAHDAKVDSKKLEHGCRQIGFYCRYLAF